MKSITNCLLQNWTNCLFFGNVHIVYYFLYDSLKLRKTVWENPFSSMRKIITWLSLSSVWSTGSYVFSNEIVLGTNVLYRAVAESSWGLMVLTCRPMFSWLPRSWKQWKDSKLTW